MHIAPEHGDVGIYGADVPFLLLKPSLANIAKLGTPAEIVSVFESVMCDAPHIYDVLAVLWACCEYDDPDAAGLVLGYHADKGYVAGSMQADHQAHIARHLLLHGMIGAVDIKPKAGSKPIKEFKATEFVALAIAHLGMSQAEAWGLSMTALVAALNAKFPEIQKPPHGGDAPSIDEHDATMAWFDSIRGKE